MIWGGGRGGGLFMLRWLGEWLNGSGWPSAITTAATVLQIICESILSCEDKTCPPGFSCSAAYSAAFLSCVEFEPDHAVSLKQWQTQMETELPQFKYWALVLNFQLCVLRRVCWVCCSDYQVWNICPGILLWTMWTMRCQTFSSLSFFCCGAFLVWKTK